MQWFLKSKLNSCLEIKISIHFNTGSISCSQTSSSNSARNWWHARTCIVTDKVQNMSNFCQTGLHCSWSLRTPNAHANTMECSLTANAWFCLKPEHWSLWFVKTDHMMASGPIRKAKLSMVYFYLHELSKVFMNDQCRPIVATLYTDSTGKCKTSRYTCYKTSIQTNV